MSLRNREEEILTKFKNGAILGSDEEMAVLEKWFQGGLVRLGVDLVNMQATARLTKRGRWLLPVLFK